MISLPITDLPMSANDIIVLDEILNRRSDARTGSRRKAGGGNCK
jgi:hypothetical protein